MGHRTFAGDEIGAVGAGDFPGFGTADEPVGPATGGVAGTAARSDHQHPILRANTRAGVTALVTADMPDGTPVYLVPRDATFILTTSALTVDNVRVIASDDPLRQWLRRVEYSQKFSQQVDWNVDTAAGNDDATGLTGAPLKTVDECVCRLWQAVFPVASGDACVVKLVGDMAATDSGHFNVRGTGAFPLTLNSPLGYDTAFVFLGVPVDVGFAGVMSGVQNGALGSLLDIHFTDVGIPVSFTASGFLARDLIFKRTTLPETYFFPAKDLGAKTLRCSQPNENGVFGSYPALANGDTYRILTLPHIHDVDFPASNANYADYQIALCYDVTPPISAPVTDFVTRYGFSDANAQQRGGAFYNCQLPNNANLGGAIVGTVGQMVSGLVRANAGVTNGRLTIGSGNLYEISAEGDGFTTFQGCDLVVDVNAQVMRAQIMFFDITTALVLAASNAHVNLITIGGAGNTNKIFINGPVSSIGYDFLPNAAMTTDVLPYVSIGVANAAPISTPASLAYQGTN